jgi:hypothetical protein
MPRGDDGQATREAVAAALASTAIADLADLTVDTSGRGTVVLSRRRSTEVTMWHDVQADARAELAFDPNVDDSGIAIAADGGAVSLRGTVDGARGVRQAESAARRVRGVTSVCNHLGVWPLAIGPSADADIRTPVLQALMLNVTIPATIHANVARGVVHLPGDVAVPA